MKKSILYVLAGLIFLASCSDMYIPPKKKIIDVMHQLQKEKVHMAVVMDEYGGTLGIVTLEDILEQEFSLKLKERSVAAFLQWLTEKK